MPTAYPSVLLRERKTLLTKQEEIDLARVIRSTPKGSPSWTAARREMTERNMPLVARLAKKLPSQPFEDMFQEGCMGLMEATQRFDPDAGFRFTTYA